MKSLIVLLAILPMVVFSQSTHTKKELQELNEYLFSEYALHKNTQPLADVATEDFVLIAAPGMVETKQQAIDGVKNVEVSSLHVGTDKVLVYETVGVVIGVLEMEGTLNNRPLPKIRYSSTFVNKDGEWKLLCRTMTPIRNNKP